MRGLPRLRQLRLRDGQGRFRSRPQEQRAVTGDLGRPQPYRGSARRCARGVEAQLRDRRLGRSPPLRPLRARGSAGRDLRPFHAAFRGAMTAIPAPDRDRQTTARPDPTGIDAYGPAQMAERVERAGISKAALPALSVFTLAVLAGVFIAFGAMRSEEHT